MAAGAFSFPRTARLKRRTLIAPLFRRGEGSSIATGTIRLLYRVRPAEARAPVQVAFIPGKRAGAVPRNRVRRALREVYRLHQQGLVGLFCRTPHALNLAILYRGPDAAPFAAIARDLPVALRRLEDALRAEWVRNPSAPSA